MSWELVDQTKVFVNLQKMGTFLLISLLITVELKFYRVNIEKNNYSITSLFIY